MDFEQITDDNLIRRVGVAAGLLLPYFSVAAVQLGDVANDLARRFKAKDARIAELEAQAVVMRALCKAASRLSKDPHDPDRRVEHFDALTAYHAMEGKG